MHRDAPENSAAVWFTELISIFMYLHRITVTVHLSAAHNQDPKRKSAYGMVEVALGASSSTAFAISSVSVQLRVSQIVNAAPDKCHIRIF